MGLDLTDSITSVVSAPGGLTTQAPAVAAVAVLVLAGVIVFRFGVRLVRSFMR